MAFSLGPRSLPYTSSSSSSNTVSLHRQIHSLPTHNAPPTPYIPLPAVDNSDHSCTSYLGRLRTPPSSPPRPTIQPLELESHPTHPDCVVYRFQIINSIPLWRWSYQGILHSERTSLLIVLVERQSTTVCYDTAADFYNSLNAYLVDEPCLCIFCIASHVTNPTLVVVVAIPRFSYYFVLPNGHKDH
ncbi:hypothetical protein M422DRAFT_777216 [Sphaerobolus stellatus SS14]|nr:hypothetical protein M422DRAFT_777216 [Sphaerobolus stellatus SS14]